MDEQKKQQMMIGVLVALGLGAGTYFVAFRESDGPTKSTAIVENPIRKPPATTAENDKGKRHEPRTITSKTERTGNIQRKVREHGTPTAGPRKGIKRGKVKVKPITLKPMG